MLLTCGLDVMCSKSSAPISDKSMKESKDLIYDFEWGFDKDIDWELIRFFYSFFFFFLRCQSVFSVRD